MKNIFITWHYTTHGIAYMKHILSAFYNNEIYLEDKKIEKGKLSQITMNNIFNKKIEKGFLFDKIYYLTAPQETFDKISSRRLYYRKNILTDEEIRKTNMVNIWEDVIDQDFQKQNDSLRLECDFVQQKYPKEYATFKSQIWRDMQHYKIDSQIEWFKEMSNAKDFYEKRFEEVNLLIQDLRNEQEIAKEVEKWILKIKEKHRNDNFIINVSLGSNETQVAWFGLAEAKRLFYNSRFIKTYDDKSDEENERFKLFKIQEYKPKIISEIIKSLNVYDNPTSKNRKLVNIKIETYLRQGFGILILGERGIGKSKIINDIIEKKEKNYPFASADCASFDNDNKAESELFGYEKNSFTGSDTKGKEGLFHQANGGILFLDEVHNLSKLVQAKLMKALQTNSNNDFSIRKMGAIKEEKIKCIVIFASNRPIDELKQILLPDLFDRIAQLIVEFPPLRETIEDREKDWENIWKQLKFDTLGYEIPKEKELLDWLKTLPLYGNFRDLQKIAMYYKVFQDLPIEAKNEIQQKNAFEYAKFEFEKYFSPINPIIQENLYFTKEKSAKIMETQFHKDLIDWADNNYHNKPEIWKELSISQKTYNNWKNGK